MEKLINKAARRRRSGEKGFTLIELLVVIAVLAILAAIVIFNVTGVTKRGSSSQCATDLKSVQTASDAYYNDNGKKYATADGNPGVAGGAAADLVQSKLEGQYLHTYPTEQTWHIDSNGTVTNTCSD